MELPKAVFIQVLVALVFFLWLARGGKIKLPSISLPIGLFLTWCLLSLLWAVNSYDGIVVLGHWITNVLIILLVMHIKNLKPLLITGTISGFLVALYGMFQVWGIDFLNINCVAGKYGSFFGHKNVAGRFMVATLPFAIISIFIIKSKIRWVFAPMALTVLSFGYFCESRAAILAIFCMVFLGLMLVTWNMHTLKRKIIIPGIVVLFGLMAVSFYSNIDKIKAKADSRIQLYTCIIKDGGSFKGVGLGNTKAMYNSLPNRPNWTISQSKHVGELHNDYLQIWFELGHVGVLLFLFCMYSIGKLFYKNRKDPIKMAMALSVIGLGITGIFSFPAYMPISPMMIGINLGVAECAGLEVQKDYQKI